MTSPAVKNISWGKVEVEGYPVFKDVKLFPGGARKWDWRETGTQHSPGIQMADVAELIDQGAKVIILSKGVLGRLMVSEKFISKLTEMGLEIHAFRTNQAVIKYNELRRNTPVGALIHSPC